MSEFDPELFRQDDEAETVAQQGYLLSAREAIGAARGVSIGDDLEQQGPEGLLFTGDAIRSLTPEQITAVGEFANRLFGVEVRPVQSVERELGESALGSAERGEGEPEPVLATEEIFRKWATEHGYSDRRGVMSWGSLSYTSSPLFQPDDEHPPLRWMDAGSWYRKTVDLRSVHDRLLASDMKSTAWKRGTPAHVNFLAHMVNELVQPEEPLPLSFAEFRERKRNQRERRSER